MKVVNLHTEVANADRLNEKEDLNMEVVVLPRLNHD